MFTCSQNKQFLSSSMILCDRVRSICSRAGAWSRPGAGPASPRSTISALYQAGVEWRTPLLPSPPSAPQSGSSASWRGSGMTRAGGAGVGPVTPSRCDCHNCRSEVSMLSREEQEEEEEKEGGGREEEHIPMEDGREHSIGSNSET